MVLISCDDNDVQFYMRTIHREISSKSETISFCLYNIESNVAKLFYAAHLARLQQNKDVIRGTQQQSHICNPLLSRNILHQLDMLVYQVWFEKQSNNARTLLGAKFHLPFTETFFILFLSAFSFLLIWKLSHKPGRSAFIVRNDVCTIYIEM